MGIPEKKGLRQLKEALTSVRVLACPDFSKRFVLQTDVSIQRLGAILTQYLKGGERVIVYSSRTLASVEKITVPPNWNV